jgi:polyisoprenoid-binding protein YceI
METQNFEIVSAQSNIDWVGRKVTGAHNGTIGIKVGSLTFKNGKLSLGNFIIDTTSIKILDVTDPATNEQFASHLASDDFFNSKQYPEANLVIKSAEPKGNSNYHIEGDLTIKGIVHPIGFDAQVEYTDGKVTASGKIVIDRTKYGIRFRSGNFFKDLGDTLIYNDIDLNVNITAKAVA